MEGQKGCKDVHQNGHRTAQVGMVIVPFPAQSHLNQILHLAHRIASFGIPVHYAGSTIHNHQAKLRFQGWDPEISQKIEFHDLQLPPYSSPPPNPDPSTHFPVHLQPLFLTSVKLREPLFQLLQDLSPKFERIVIIHDSTLASAVQDVKLIPNAEAYMLIPVSAFCTFIGFWESLPETPFPLDFDIATNTPSLEGCFTPEMLSFVYGEMEFLHFQAGRLFNTSRVIEGRYLELMERLPVYDHMKNFAVGPFNPTQIKSTSDKKRHTCLEWLDKQEVDSVIYVCFGSITPMSHDQIIELAKGLEQSGVKFIWVLRTPDKADVISGGEEGNPQLPEGYEERLKNRGMVVRDWAPQQEILAHQSTGGFMSHCGWNSCIESITMGVPIAAWPMHSDQPRNATLVTQVLRTGIAVRDWTPRVELVASHTIEEAVRRLMVLQERKEIRKRAAEVGEAVRDSVAEGGASHLEMEAFIAHITR